MDKSIPSPFMPQDTPEQYERLLKHEMLLLRVFRDTNFLKSMRLVFYQKALTNEQIESIQKALNQDIIGVIKKVLLQPIDWTAPIFNQGSYWMNMKYDQVLTNEVRPQVIGNQRAVIFLQNGIKRLEAIVSGQDEIQPMVIDLEMKNNYLQTPHEEVKIEMISFQKGLEYLESGLLVLQGYAKREFETDEQKKDRQDKDSTQ